jgi:hypothetical protein
MGVGCGWVCPTSRPRWVWGVGTQWAGIGVRGRVILEPVIFIVPVGNLFGNPYLVLNLAVYSTTVLLQELLVELILSLYYSVCHS